MIYSAKSILIVSLSAMLLIPIFTVAQSAGRSNEPQEQIKNALVKYYKLYPHEKAFLHTDNDFYLSGDTIWYKTYLMAYGKPSQLSRIIYIRLQDSAGKMIMQDTQPINDGASFGNMNLPDSLVSGRYQLFAFTNWMLNFDKRYIFHKNIYIQNIKDMSRAVRSIPKVSKYRIVFFPEGGNLVANNISTIAFKATDEYDLPVNIYGEVTDDQDKTLARVVTVHDGMGSFDLKIEANANYFVNVHFTDSSIRRFALPKVQSKGISIRMVPSSQDELGLLINNTGLDGDNNDIFLAATQDNGSFTVYPLKLDPGPNLYSFKKDKYATGVLHFTILDKRKKVLAERSIYVNNDDRLKISAVEDSLPKTDTGRNTLTITLKDKLNHPVNGNGSIAIAEGVTAGNGADNICSYFLLSAETDDKIYHPAYYFENNDTSHLQAIDLLMRTTHWRSLNWDKMFENNQDSLRYPIEQTFTIAGKIENYKKGKPVKINLLFMNSDSTKNLVTVEPTQQGIFSINDYKHKGWSDINYQIVDEKNRHESGKITFFTKSADTVRFSARQADDFALTAPVSSNEFWDEIKKKQKERLSLKGNLLKTVEIKGKKLSSTEQLIKDHVLHLEIDQGYTLDLVNNNAPGSISLISYIQGKFPGLNITPSADGTGASNFSYHGPSGISQGKRGPNEIPNEPYFYVDEASATASEVLSIPLSDIALIRYAPPPVWFAPMNGGPTGALLIYTKRFGDEKNRNTNIYGTGQYRFNGYSVTQEFFLPGSTPFADRNQADFRQTLYWQHDLNFDYKNQIKIKFNDSDHAKKYRIVIQGVDIQGRPCYLNQIL